MQEKQHIGHISVHNKMARTIWNIIMIFLFRPFGTKFFRLWRIFILRLFGADVSFGAEVYASVKIWAPWKLRMKKGSCLGPRVVCYNQAMITLEENAVVSQDVYICTASHDINKPNTASQGLIIAPIIIGKDTWIASKAFIGMGVVIGEGAVVGATASVFKDVEPWTVVGGNPAKYIKKREITL